MSLPVTEAHVEAEVIRLLSSFFSKACRDLSGHSRLVEDLNVDSMEVVEIVMLMSDGFNVELSSDEVTLWRSINDIVKSVIAAQ
ncbi:acyl carrier protein [Pseudomonas citrulli]|uniref:Acyl carrier protein n=1 Tax=Pseudomonas citrulli TaxID=3064347 RepID=A0ABT9BW32_9PSED|nr:acyl carrier protein [Pseudomonas sp. K18]MDO7896749.1 acyl carrier protein [Pseudomonas sp. K18]